MGPCALLAVSRSVEQHRTEASTWEARGTQLHITWSVIHPRAPEAPSRTPASFLFCVNRGRAWPPFGPPSSRGLRTEVPPSLSGPATPKCPRNHSRARSPIANPRVGRRSPGRAHSCLASPSVVGGRVCGPPHAEGRVPGDHTGAAEGAALPGDHPLLRQRQGKKKKKKKKPSDFGSERNLSAMAIDPVETDS